MFSTNFSPSSAPQLIFLVYFLLDVLKNNELAPPSLLPVCGKLFERLIFNKVFEFFIDKDLISPS